MLTDNKNETSRVKSPRFLKDVGLPPLPSAHPHVISNRDINIELPPLPKYFRNELSPVLNFDMVSRPEVSAFQNCEIKGSISDKTMEGLGLPRLPSFILSQFPSSNISKSDFISGRGISSNVRSVKSLSEIYASDNSHLNRLLEVTSLLIDRMPPTVATDCLVEMPNWMRHIYLSRHGISRVIGLMLATRLEAAGQTSLVNNDGFVEVHTVLAPSNTSFNAGNFLNALQGRNCSLNRLTASARNRSRGIVISAVKSRSKPFTSSFETA